MGIYDRDYYRKEGPSFLGNLDHGKVCLWIIATNIVFFIVQMSTLRPVLPANYGLEVSEDDPAIQQMMRWMPGMPKASPFTDALDLDVPKVLHGQVWRLITHAFLHDTTGYWHILWNMLILFMFGRDMEDMYGWREFLAFYLFSALLGGLAYTAAYLMGVYHGVALGASGAVTAVVTLFACHFPTRIILVMFFLPVPVWLFVLVTVAHDAFSVLGRVNNGIAAAAHLGGAVFAFAYYRQQWRVLKFGKKLST
jgi:membrane associated rhomboid family serine protease